MGRKTKSTRSMRTSPASRLCSSGACATDRKGRAHRKSSGKLPVMYSVVRLTTNPAGERKPNQHIGKTARSTGSSLAKTHAHVAAPVEEAGSSLDEHVRHAEEID
eukprot:7377968-Prymnesium_polylepis.2